MSQTHLIVACRGWFVLWKWGRGEAGSTSWTGKREIWSLCPGSLCFSSPSWMPVGVKNNNNLIQITSWQFSYKQHADFKQKQSRPQALSAKHWYEQLCLTWRTMTLSTIWRTEQVWSSATFSPGTAGTSGLISSGTILATKPQTLSLNILKNIWKVRCVIHDPGSTKWICKNGK